MWKDANRGELTYESYIDQYITAELPPRPDDRDNSPHACRQREYHDLVINQLYHTCMIGRCKENENDKCTKGFPVSLFFTFIYCYFLLEISSHLYKITLRLLV